jgi:hypothetical protein
MIRVSQQPPSLCSTHGSLPFYGTCKLTIIYYLSLVLRNRQQLFGLVQQEHRFGASRLWQDYRQLQSGATNFESALAQRQSHYSHQDDFGACGVR